MTNPEGAYWFLNNDYNLKEPVVFDKLFYWSITNALLAASTDSMNDRLHLCNCTPEEARGMKLEIKPDWENEQKETLKCLLSQKFSNRELRQKLFAIPLEYLIAMPLDLTVDIIIELRRQ